MASILVRVESFMARIALVCSSLKLKRAINFFDASAGLSEERIIATTSSMLATAISRPSRIFLRPSALSKSNVRILRSHSRI